MTAVAANNGMFQEQYVYLFSYFSNERDGLKLCYSNDFYNWTDIPGSYLCPRIGDRIMRDPFIQHASNGTFHLVWTTGWARKDIGYSSSKDLVHWTEQRLIPVMAHEKRARNCWAPKIFYVESEKKWLILWSTWIDDGSLPAPEEPNTRKNHRIYYVTTTDFVTFSKAKKYFDPGHSCIDAYLLIDDKEYLLFYKDERENEGKVLDPEHQNIHYAKGPSPYGPFTDFSPAITSQNGATWFNEGPCAIKIGREYLVYYDHHSDVPVPKYYGAVKSTDLKNWTDVSHLMSFPPGTKHGSIIKVKASCLAVLQSKASTNSLGRE